MPLSVAIIGASADRSKYGNKAVRAYRDAGWDVFPVHPSLDEVEGLRCFARFDLIPVPVLDRVSFYVPPEVGIQVLDQLDPRRVRELFLNPGSESDALVAKATEKGIAVVTGCAILALGRNPGAY
jgi:predicted CoA-binding protein